MIGSPTETFPDAARRVAAEWGEAAWTSPGLYGVAVLERALVDSFRVPGAIIVSHPDPRVTGHWR